MLSLYCGEASSAERARRLNASAEGTLLVVPDDLKRRVLAREWGGAGHTAGAIQVIALPDLIERLIPEDSSRRWASPGIVRAAIRSIIESEPRRFDYLVGAKSAPRLTEGVLNRIVSAMEAQTRKDATEEFSGNPSGRERQLRALLDTLHKRLDGSQVRQEKFALLQALSELSSEDWRRDFLDFEKVVFLDFDRWDDAGFMTVSAATRITKDVIVLLDFYPDAEHDAYLPLEPAYQRFYEMADHYILGADELESGEWAEDLSKVKLPVVISAKSKVEEIRAAVCVINSLFEGRQSGLKPTVTIALPNWEAYAPELERALEGVGEAVVWYRKVSALKCSKWKMLERVRDASHAQVSSGEIASLWRAPGFTGLTEGKISQVDAWELAARLDYITTITGKVVGWPRIVRHVKMALRQLQSERNRRGLLSSEEIGLDDHLLAALEISHDLLKSFRGKRDISKWSEMVAAIWQKSLAGLSGDDQNLDQLISAMTDITGEMSEFSDFISDKPVRFSGYFGLLRTALHEVSEDNTDHFENALVTVCPASIASEIRSDVCFVLGCNDGNFPYFARPEPSFSDQWMRESQARVRGAQQQVLQQ